MLQMRDDKSGWSIGEGDIIMVEDDRNVKCNLLIEYGLLIQANINDSFVAYKPKNGHQLQNLAQLANCLINSISPETSQIVLAKHHLCKSQSIACGDNLFKVLIKNK